jgi:ATP:ADP antiporter, AAA family
MENERISKTRTLLTHPEPQSSVSFPFFQVPGEKPKGPLEKLLSVFADVRAGEAAGALLLAANIFLLLTGYLILKVAREPLILTQGGAEVKAYASAAQAALLVLAVPIYGWFGTKVNRLRLVVGLELFFASHLLIFSTLGHSGVRIAVPYYIWVGIFSLFIISQFWAFANDLYTEGQGRRLFPLVGVGSSLGAVAGARAAAVLAKSYHLTPYALMLVCTALLLISIFITVAVSRRSMRDDREVSVLAAEPLGKQGGFQLLLGDRYLFWIAVLTILLNIVNTSGEYLLGKLVEVEAVQMFADITERQRFIAGFFGDYLTWTNGLGFLLQLLIVSRVIRHVGVRGSLFILPGIALISYSCFAFVPLLPVIRFFKVLENSTDYSLQNTLRQALWLTTSREAKYKAKAAVDTFCNRSGDVVAAGLIFCIKSLQLGPAAVAGTSVGMTAIWLWVASRIAREHARRTV